MTPCEKSQFVIAATESRGQVLGTPISFSGGSGLKSRLEVQVSWFPSVAPDIQGYVTYAVEDLSQSDQDWINHLGPTHSPIQPSPQIFRQG